MKLLKNCITHIMVLSILMLLLVGCQSTSQPAEHANTLVTSDTYKAGTYEGTGMGNNGKIKISVTVSDKEITDVTVLEHKESAGISDLALLQIPESIIKHQSLAVDVVSGATRTSEGLLAAAEAALKEAGADISLLKSRKIEKQAGEAMELSADVIVVGGGGAGISAAISAAENGASVILIEKSDMLGGNTRISGGAWNAVDPELLSKTETSPGQLETLKEFLDENPADYPGKYASTLISLQQEIRDYLAGDTTYMFDSINLHIIQCYQGGLRQNLDGKWYYGDYDLIKTFCENSMGTLQWVKDSWGMVWKDELFTVYGGLWKRGHYSTYVKGNGFFDEGQKYSDSLGVSIMLATEAKSLIIENDVVVGIEAEKKDGTKVTLNASKGVVMATGGYGGSPELVREYNNYWPDLPDELTTNNVSSVVGDGIFMCRDIGAALEGMDFVQLMALSHPVTNTNTGMASPPENTLYVNKEGVRFVNEYAARDVIAAAAFEQTDGMFYSIEDQEVAEIRYTQQDIDNWLDEGYIWKGETLEELASQIGIDPKVLVNTVSTYNSYVDQGSDPDFNKDVLVSKIENGPFYATPHKPNVHHTMGGVKINAKAEVLDVNGNVIPGLYAAGEVTGGIHAGNRLGGNAVADALTFGRIAGQSVTVK